MINLSNVRLRLRADTSANWTAANPILGKGEIGLIVDGSGNTTSMRIGNGSSTFSSLSDFTSGTGGGGGSMTGSEIVTAVTGLDTATMFAFVSTLLTLVLTPSSLLFVNAEGELEPMSLSDETAPPGTIPFFPTDGTDGQFITVETLLALLEEARAQSNDTLLVKEGGAVVEKTYPQLWALLYAGVVAAETVQEAPFASNVITLDTTVSSRFARSTDLTADCSIHTDSWIGITDAGRTAELRVQCGTTGYNLTVPTGTVFYNQPSGVLDPSKLHRFLLGRDGTTRTIYYAGSGVVI